MKSGALRTIKIDWYGEVSVVHISPADWFGGRAIDMKTFDDANDIIVDDWGLFCDVLVTATIGNLRRIPLPVYIVGADGEDSVDTTLDVADVRKAVRDINVVRAYVDGVLTMIDAAA